MYVTGQLCVNGLPRLDKRKTNYLMELVGIRIKRNKVDIKEFDTIDNRIASGIPVGWKESEKGGLKNGYLILRVLNGSKSAINETSPIK